MMGPTVGTRIGAILGTSDMVVQFLGYGIYQGDEVPPKEIGGYNMGLPNPKMLLDNGDVVWGCECWWGSEKGINNQLEMYRAKGYQIITVSIADVRTPSAAQTVGSNDNAVAGN